MIRTTYCYSSCSWTFISCITEVKSWICTIRLFNTYYSTRFRTRKIYSWSSTNWNNWSININSTTITIYFLNSSKKVTFTISSNCCNTTSYCSSTWFRSTWWTTRRTRCAWRITTCINLNLIKINITVFRIKKNSTTKINSSTF